jgi:heme exporter protein C
MWQAIEDPDTAADLTSVLCIVGSVFAFLSRYAVMFWNQGLHQGASLSVDAEEHVSNVYALPLWACIIGFVLLFVTLVLLRTRTEIRGRRMQALLARERRV